MEQPVPDPTKVNKNPVKRRAFPIILILLLGFAIFFSLNFRTVEVLGPSMLPTLKSGRKVLVTSAYWILGPIKKGDIVVVHEFTGNGYFIKRVHSVGGATVETAFAPRSHRIADGKFVVPIGMVHLIGDNMPQSEDSRKFGPVKTEQILGKVLVWQ